MTEQTLTPIQDVPIKIKRSYETDVPTSLKEGELAYSFSSKQLFIGDSNNAPIVIGGEHFVNVINSMSTQL